MWIICRPVAIHEKPEYWCMYASGDRWNNRISHAKKFDTNLDAHAYAGIALKLDGAYTIMRLPQK